MRALFQRLRRARSIVLEQGTDTPARIVIEFEDWRSAERALRALPALTVIDQAGNDLGPMPDTGFS